MKRRPKPMKRVRAKADRRVHRERTKPGRVFRVYPDPDRPSVIVEVRLTRDNRRMRECMDFHEGNELARDCELNCMGLVRSWWARRLRRDQTLRRGGVLARMFLNERDLRYKPSEIVSHECTHAGMAWARYRKANLRNMPGEEVLCYAVGHLVRQVNRICYAAGVWSR